MGGDRDDARVARKEEGRKRIRVAKHQFIGLTPLRGRPGPKPPAVAEAGWRVMGHQNLYLNLCGIRAW